MRPLARSRNRSLLARDIERLQPVISPKLREIRSTMLSGDVVCLAMHDLGTLPASSFLKVPGAGARTIGLHPCNQTLLAGTPRYGSGLVPHRLQFSIASASGVYRCQSAITSTRSRALHSFS